MPLAVTRGGKVLVRTAIAVVMIVVAGVYARGASGPERLPPRIPLGAAPVSIGEWQAHEAAPLADDVVAQLGVDDYMNRQYVATDRAPVSVYVGYYASQRQGDTIHSPQNCLPGAGWQPVFSDRVPIDAGGRRFPVNRFVIQKGLDRQAVFYWYQGRGRIVANEFANKGWLMLDAARLRRTDGGLVRLMTPVATTPDAAFAALTSFSAALLPHLSSHLP
jgi:EpsI family protein